MSLEKDGLEIINVKNLQNRDKNLKASTNYLSVLSNLRKSDITNECTEENKKHENTIVKLGITEYEYLQQQITLCAQCKMNNYYDENEIIIQNGFKYGVDFNISSRRMEHVTV